MPRLKKQETVTAGSFVERLRDTGNAHLAQAAGLIERDGTAEVMGYTLHKHVGGYAEHMHHYRCEVDADGLVVACRIPRVREDA